LVHWRYRTRVVRIKEQTMGQRVNVGVEQATNAAALINALKQAGAESVRGPSAELPDVLVVDLADEKDVNDFVRKAKQLPGVRYAERDSWQFTQ